MKLKKALVAQINDIKLHIDINICGKSNRVQF